MAVEDVDEVERAFGGSWISWSGSPAQRSDDAARLTEAVRRSVQSSRLTDAVSDLRAQRELMLEDPSLGIQAASSGVLVLVDDHCVRIAETSDQHPEILHQIAWTRFWVARVRGDSAAQQLSLLSDASYHLAGTRLADEAQIGRGVVLAEDGFVYGALKEFDAVIDRISNDPSASTGVLAAAWYEKSLVCCRQELWTATQHGWDDMLRATCGGSWLC